MSLARRKKSAVRAGSHSTEPGGGAGVPQQPSGQIAGERKAKELASSGDSSEPANRRPATSEGSAPLRASASAVRANKLLLAAGNSAPPRVGRRTRLS